MADRQALAARWRRFLDALTHTGPGYQLGPPPDEIRAQALRDAAQLAERHVNPTHPDCGPCAMAGVIAYELRVRADNTED